MSLQPSTGSWNLLLIAWLVALVSTLSALFIGEVMGQAPCVLCWFHTLLYAGLIPQPIQPCTATGPSCSGSDMTIFGGMPLPVLALLAFALIAVLLIIIRRRTI